MTRTSRMEAITQPGRWGMTQVRVFFTEVRPCADPVVCRGDLLQDSEGRVHVFVWS